MGIERKTFGGPGLIVGEPYTVVRWALSVTVECRCGHHHQAVLVRTSHGSASAGRCPGCGAEFDLGGMSWDGTTPLPSPAKFAIAYSPKLSEH